MNDKPRFTREDVENLLELSFTDWQWKWVEIIANGGSLKFDKESGNWIIQRAQDKPFDFNEVRWRVETPPPSKLDPDIIENAEGNTKILKHDVEAARKEVNDGDLGNDP